MTEDFTKQQISSSQADTSESRTQAIPSNFSQIVLAGQATLKLRKLKESSDSASARNLNLADMAVIGLNILLPREVKSSNILVNIEKYELLDYFMYFQLCFNDQLDIGGSDKFPEVAQEATDKAEKAKLQLEKRLENSNNPTLVNIMQNFIDENIVIENEIRRRNFPLTLEEAIEYRNLSNAIYECAVLAFIIDPESLGDRLYTIPKNELSWQAVSQKYNWIFNNEFRDRVERAVLITHNLAMVTQIQDDMVGMELDEKLEAPNIALSVYKTEGSQKSKLTILKEREKAYMDKARKLGIGIIPAIGFEKLIQLTQIAQSNSVKKQKGERMSVLNKIFTRREGKVLWREKQDILGRFNTGLRR